MKLSSFDEKVFAEIFTLYRNINRCHWKIPDFAAVQESLEKEGVFAFHAKGRWSSKLVFKKEGDSILLSFIPRQDVPQKIKEKLAAMKEQFEQAFRKQPFASE
ncbi:hypothetical protein HYS48_01715 [Candidatus Woesearchaeota archaeon]|nr:hypothetical protein [Candidatus Woesearchaeota archaeon]